MKPLQQYLKESGSVGLVKKLWFFPSEKQFQNTKYMTKLVDDMEAAVKYAANKTRYDVGGTVDYDVDEYEDGVYIMLYGYDEQEIEKFAVAVNTEFARLNPAAGDLDLDDEIYTDML